MTTYGTSIASLLVVGAVMAPAVATYAPRDPSHTVLYHVIAEHLETFLASCEADPDAMGLPAYVQREFYDYLQCGILAHGFLRLGCDTCHHELLVSFSCKRRGFCPSCAGRRMAQMAAHLVEQVIPWVPTRQWVVSVPVPLRYWTAASQDLTAHVHTIIRRTIVQYYVNQAVQRGHARATVHPGSVTFIQRFGSALQLNVHYHVLCLEGVFLERTDQGRPPRFLAGEPPTDTDIAAVVQKISRRVIRLLRRLGYLEADLEPPWPLAMIPCARPPRNWLAPWRRQSSNASRGVNGPGSTSGVSAPDLVTRVRRPGSRDRVALAATAFRCTPTRRFRRIGGINWNSSSAIPPVAPCRWSASRKTSPAIWSIPSPTRGRTGRRGFGSHRWNCWRSSRRSCPCRTCIWCAMAAVWRRTAIYGGRSSQRHVSKVSTSRRRT